LPKRGNRYYISDKRSCFTKGFPSIFPKKLPARLTGSILDGLFFCNRELSDSLLDQLKDEWRVGEKRLYEIGLPGRYNKLGEWKPIIYPGNSDPLAKDASSLSEDPDIQGALFYMMCTGYRVIEFVALTTIELPTDNISFQGRFHLWQCSPLKEDSHLAQNFRIYDGWLELDSGEPEYIKSEIALIGVILNRLAFTYGGTLKWRVKYSMVTKESGWATPSEEDLHILDSMFRDFPQTEDAIILDASIDWYNRGRSSRNIFSAFLCYYIALESVAISVADGKADLSLGYPRETKKDQKKKRIECISEKHNNIYSKDQIRFVQEAYFDCVLSLKEKTQRVAELVFGLEHQHLKALFEKRNGYSLSDIRGKLAHGAVTLLDKEDESLVADRLHEIAEISKEFLIRIILFLKPSDPLPSWSQKHSISFHSSDPRSTLVATTEKIFPSKDWRIRPEWCD
jgi:hypothetical protein